MRARTIGDVITGLVGSTRLATFARWPPDAFALTSVLLSDSGAYRQVVSPPAKKVWPPAPRWAAKTRQTGRLWRRWAVGGTPPRRLLALLGTLEAARSLRLSQLCGAAHWNVCTAILELHAMADAACAGVGIPGSFPSKDWIFYLEANHHLLTKHTLSRRAAGAVRVLPKLRTPHVGISLRSLSHHLAVDRSEVATAWYWHHTLTPADALQLNILVLPWPLTVEARDFRETEGPLENMDLEHFGFFEFVPGERFKLTYARKALRAAARKIDRVDCVVLPEGALEVAEVTQLQRVLREEGVGCLIAGVRGPRCNYAHLGLLDGKRWLSYRQDKHHRWLLDGAQIQQYHLGSALHPGRRWWEAIDLAERRINFVSANGWLTMCHLICEDLARQDPVTQVVRAVGPNLVVALLLDGPQLAARWPARYASVLADDPGSSVLTVTSLGMAMRSRPEGKGPSSVIALWKDARTGVREVALGKGETAAVLTLCAHMTEEWVADGRTDGETASELVLSGVTYLS